MGREPRHRSETLTGVNDAKYQLPFEQTAKARLGTRTVARPCAIDYSAAFWVTLLSVSCSVLLAATFSGPMFHDHFGDLAGEVQLTAAVAIRWLSTGPTGSRPRVNCGHNGITSSTPPSEPRRSKGTTGTQIVMKSRITSNG